MIKRGLIELIFSAFSIERWNDHPRTSQFSEMDKQAHKALIAYVIARTEQDRGASVDWEKLIQGGIFEFLHRVVVTDIKPPVFHRLMADQKLQRQLNGWVLDQLQPLLGALPGGVMDRCSDYFLEEPRNCLERRILSAAHYLATRWEFSFIYSWSKPLYGIERTHRQIMDEIESHKDLAAVAQCLESISSGDSQGLYGFISLMGQLRFQKRWTQFQRIPATSVLGHLLMVAQLCWFTSLEIGAGATRQRNNFYCGLFHDLPEVLTRDIVSPVKRSVQGLEELIKELERQSVQEAIFPLIPQPWREDLLYLIADEFSNRIRPGGRVELLQRDLGPEDDGAELDGIDGALVELCDKLSAFIEASQSIRMGVSSPGLRESRRRIAQTFGRRRISGCDLGVLFDYFD